MHRIVDEPDLHWLGSDLRLYRYAFAPNSRGVAFVCVAIPDSVMLTDPRGLHRRAAEAVATHGRSEVERVLGERVPPRRIDVHRHRPPTRTKRQPLAA